MPRLEPPAIPLPLQQAVEAGPGPQPDWPQAFALLGAMHERERSQAARVLHDRIAQSLSAIKMSAHLCLSEGDPVQVREDLEGMMAMAHQAVLELRAVEQGLSPPRLESVGLHGALHVEAHRHFPEERRTPLELHFEDLPKAPAFAPAMACLRILRQALQSLAPDSEAGVVKLYLAPADADRFKAGVLFHPASDWPGFHPPQLELMRALAAACGGALQGSHAASGTQQWIALSLPYACPDGHPATTSAAGTQD